MIDAINAPLVWQTADAPVAYDLALADMTARASDIAAGCAAERVWLLEHPSLYTAGTSARPADLISPDALPVHVAGRGGEYTYHGPGQRIAYVQIDLARRDRDVRCYVSRLEGWIIDTLARFDIAGERRAGRVGVWVVDSRGRECKIAAIGVRVRRWVTLHGIAINIDPDLAHYQGIVPCGLADYAVTSMAELGKPATHAAVDAALMDTFPFYLNNLSTMNVCPR